MADRSFLEWPFFEARHRDLAELVGASRPRITEHLIAFERKHLISRNSRQLVVNRDRLEGFLAQTHLAAANAELRKSIA